MATAKRATVYFDSELHRALKLKAAASDRSISDVVSEAVRQALAEDAADLAAFADRERETTISFDRFVRDLERRGRL
jgi:plasmid stability protein